MADNLIYFQGKQVRVTLPSGKIVTYREANGADEEILSGMKNALEGVNTINYLGSILVNDEDLNRKPTSEDLLNWKINDKYFLLFHQRLTNHGEDLNFPYHCNNPKCEHNKVPFTVECDLKEFVTDFSTSPIKIGDSKYAAKAYPQGKSEQVLVTLPDGKSFRFSILTELLERKESLTPQSDVNKNTKLRNRNLEVERNGSWQLVTYFGEFSARELSIIRKSVSMNDEMFNPMLEFSCPKCETPHILPLMTLPAFFYPEEEI